LSLGLGDLDPRGLAISSAPGSLPGYFLTEPLTAGVVDDQTFHASCSQESPNYSVNMILPAGGFAKARKGTWGGPRPPRRAVSASVARASCPWRSSPRAGSPCHHPHHGLEARATTAAPAGVHPLMTPTGRSRATFLEIPTLSTTSTT